jgi:hypothetical protein
MTSSVAARDHMVVPYMPHHSLAGLGFTSSTCAIRRGAYIEVPMCHHFIVLVAVIKIYDQKNTTMDCVPPKVVYV